MVNMGGSIAFGAAAIASRYMRANGEIANVALVNLGTFVGAVCFFVGALLLPIESARDSASPPASPASGDAPPVAPT